MSTNKWLNFQIDDEATKIEERRLRNRVKRCRCSYCGGSLELRKLTYSSYEVSKLEVYCDYCKRIEYGVEPEIYDVSEYFVDELGFDYYKDLDNNIRKREMNIAKVSEIVEWGCKNLGLLNEDGFTSKIDINKALLGEALLIEDDQMEPR
mgnify:CR=1 FL=1